MWRKMADTCIMERKESGMTGEGESIHRCGYHDINGWRAESNERISLSGSADETAGGAGHYEGRRFAGDLQRRGDL